MSRPAWVEVGLFGIESRKKAMSWFVSSLVGAFLLFIVTVMVLSMMLDAPILVAILFGLILGGLVGLASLWYWLCIYWMDKNGGWSQER
jgi:cell shape-determining protein MreD